MPQPRIDPIVPSEQDTMLARTAHLKLERSEALDHALHVQVQAAGRELASFDLPEVVTRLLMEILKETAAGRAVSLVTVDAEVTTQQAATILNVSRPYLVSLIEKGLLPARKVGNQRRLPLADVLEYKAANRAKRRETLREMAALDQELGLI